MSAGQPWAAVSAAAFDDGPAVGIHTNGMARLLLRERRIIAEEDALARLLALNLERSAGGR